MPTYQYSCAKCGHEFEVFQSMKDDALETCPKDKCGRQRWGRGKVKRLVGAGAGLIFKGSGFYITDYRSESYKAGAKSDTSSSASGSSSSSPGAGASSSPAPSSTGGGSKSEGSGGSSKPASTSKPKPKAT